MVSGHTSFRELKHKWTGNGPALTFQRGQQDASRTATRPMDAKRLAHEGGQVAAPDRAPAPARRVPVGLQPAARRRRLRVRQGSSTTAPAPPSRSRRASSTRASRCITGAWGSGTDANGAGEFVGPRFGPKRVGVDQARSRSTGRRRAGRAAVAGAAGVRSSARACAIRAPSCDYRAAPLHGLQRRHQRRAVRRRAARLLGGDRDVQGGPPPRGTREQPFLRAPGRSGSSPTCSRG